jgi:hypothetical protein
VIDDSRFRRGLPENYRDADGIELFTMLVGAFNLHEAKEVFAYLAE